MTMRRSLAFLLFVSVSAAHAQIAAGAPAEAAGAAEAAASAPPQPPQPSCSALTARAMSADLRAATAQSQNKDLDTLAPLFDEAVSQWTAARTACDGRARERADRNLMDNQKQRAGIAERQAAGSQCELSHKDGSALQELARVAFGERRWSDAALLYAKAETMWDLANEHCTGTQKEIAAKRREQSEIDGHNAEFCAPVFEKAGDYTKKFRNGSAGLPLADRQQQSQIAETLWRDTARQCRGNAMELAGNNAQALARDRGTPWVATAAPGAPPPTVAMAAAPRPAGATTAASATAAKAVAAAPKPSPPEAPKTSETAALPKELDVRSGDTRYKGQFVREEGQVVSGTGRVEWANGDVYEGPLIRNVRNGRGDFTWASGQRYIGDWVNDKATGKGSLRFANGNQYEGDIVDGQPQGEGQMIYASGDQYKGQMVQGMPHGKGSYVWLNGQRYEGEWVNDKPQGQGVLRFANGNRYDGTLQAGLPHGKGRMSFASGDQYDGLFDRGLAHGTGVYIWKAGDRYEGAWRAGKKHGQGNFIWASGDRWEGEFKDDERTEEGTLYRKEK
ncbi:hypothetical protein BH11PSE10_BH11PSE10_08160 [soil metagenome]